VLQVTARPPSPRSLNFSIPLTVERVILTTMSKKREERYDTATRLSEALKVAIEPPTSALHDTQPGFPRPEALAPPLTPPDPASVSVANTPPPPNASVIFTPPPASSPYGLPRVRQRLRSRRGNLWVNVGVGGLIGCGLLILIALVVLIALSGILRNSQATPTPNVPGGIASPRPATATIAATRAAALATTHPPPTNTTVPATEAVSATAVLPVGQRGTLAPLGQGEIVYFAERDNNFDLYRMNLSTRAETRLTSGASSELYPSVSPDGSQIVFMSDADGDYDIYRMDVNGGGVHRLTNNTVDDRLPSWSPDGQWILFSSDTRGDGSHDLYQVRADGSDLHLLYSDGERNTSPHFSVDERYVVFTGGAVANGATWEIRRLEVDTGTVIDLTDNTVKDSLPAFAPDGSVIYVTEGDGHAAIARVGIDGGESRIVYDGAGYDWGARYSPAGDLIAFTSDLSGRDELYLIDADGTNVRAVTDSGGMGAEWLPQ
jgi:TolB protein